jgi:hypothetical protein
MSNQQSAPDGRVEPAGSETQPAEMADNAERLPPTDTDPDALYDEMTNHPAAQPPDRSHA